MKTIRTFFAAITLLLLFSFTGKQDGSVTGTYGVCDSDPSQIKLTLNEDHSFYYQDFSIHDQKIRINGTWSQKGNKVVLKGYQEEHNFHHIWTFDREGQVAKSRKGLTFYRLGKLAS